MAYTQADLDVIRAAIATGATTVRFPDGKFIEYRSLADMRAIEADIAAEVNADSSVSTRVRQMRIVACKGL